MPEGHSIRRLANAFERSFVGRQVQLSSPQGRFADGAALLTGETMVATSSTGKHLFLGFSPESDGPPEQWIHTHLGLYGAWRFAGAIPEDSIGAPRVSDPDQGYHLAAVEEQSWPPEPRGLVRLRILTADMVADLNGPNQCRVVTTAEKLAVEDKLGPDPLDPAALESPMEDEFVGLVRASARPVGDLVMDQSVSAGVGNIYRAEALFRSGISPNRLGRNVSERRLRELWRDFVHLMRKGVAEGAINTVEEDEIRIDEGDPEAARWYVYHREGRSCLRCGNPVQMADMKGRRLYWCPRCQR